jgi:AraC family transcriptional regulator
VSLFNGTYWVRPGMSHSCPFQGQVLRHRQTPAFRLTETVFRGDAILRWHEHETAYVSFLLAGGYEERTRLGKRDCSMGAVIWHPAGETHSDRFSKEGGHILNLEFRSRWLQSIRSEAALPENARFFWGGLAYALGLKLYRFLNSGVEAPSDLAIEFLRLCAGSCDGHQQPAWVGRVLELIYETYNEKITLGQAAEVAGVHPVHVSRSFRRFLGCNFNTYIAQVRLRRVFDLLRQSEESIAYLAAECGFADQPHMCRRFKQSTGITPSTYRRSMRS